MNSILIKISNKGKFYDLLPNYKVISEDIKYKDNNLEVNAEFITNISRYKFLTKILNKLIDQKLLHLETKFEFDSNLNQIKFFVKPKLVDYFECSGILYCDNDYSILSHMIHIEYIEKFNMIKSMFDDQIKKNIISQIENDIREFKKIMEKN